MTIIFMQGDVFWIESHMIDFVIVDAAGTTLSAITNLDKPGTCLGYSMTLTETDTNTNVRALGGVMLQNQAGAIIHAPVDITGIRIRSSKEVGSTGNVTVDYNVILFMRKSRG